MRRYTATLTQNAAITLSLNENEDAQLLLTQGGTGSYTATWPGVNTWLTPSGAAPVLKTAVGATDLLTFSRTGGFVYGVHTGDTGLAGATGTTGPAGITWRGQWVNTVNYAVNDVVFQSSSSYICVQANGPATSPVTPGTDPTKWAVLAAASVQIVQGGGGDSVDTFNRVGVTNIATQTAPPAPWLYTAVFGTHISLNGATSQLFEDATGVGRQVYRVESPMSLANHHAEITVGAVQFHLTDNIQLGVCCRFAAGASTFYYAVATGDATAANWQVQTWKCVAGTFTGLGNGPAFTTLPKAGDKLKLDCNGTTITAYWNGILAMQITDSSIDGTTVGGKQAGLVMNLSSGSVVGNTFSQLSFGI